MLMHFNTINHFSGIQTVFAVTVLSPYSCLLFNSLPVCPAHTGYSRMKKRTKTF